MKFTTALAALLFSASTLLAAPVKLPARDVWVPQILYPDASTVWQVGETYNVTWALDQKPDQVTNPIGTVFLAKDGLLDVAHPLAKGFNLTDGIVNVTIPADVVPGTDYTVVLLGDSGNDSPIFTIVSY